MWHIDARHTRHSGTGLRIAAGVCLRVSRTHGTVGDGSDMRIDGLLDGGEFATVLCVEADLLGDLVLHKVVRTHEGVEEVVRHLAQR